MSAVEIRPATLQDLPAVAALEQDLARTDAPEDRYLVRAPAQREGDDQLLRRVIVEDWGVCLVAVADGRVVGSLSGSTKEAPHWRPVKMTEIHGLFVEEAYRDRGIGTRLVEEFARWSRARGAQVVAVSAFASNVRGIEFYEKAGFRPTLVHLELPLG